MLCSYSPKKPNQKASGRVNSTQLHEYFVVCCLQRTAVRRPLIHSCAYCYSQRGDKLPHICSQIFVHLNFASICCYKCARHKWLDYICERTLLQQHISYIFVFGIKVNLASSSAPKSIMLADDQAHYIISKLPIYYPNMSCYKITTECKYVPTYSQ